MTVITVEIRNARDNPWPTRGHHLRIMSFEDAHANRGVSVDVAADVGINHFEVPDGTQVLRLFHTEGSWDEEQVRRGVVDPHVAFDLPEPVYAFTRPTRFLVVDGVTSADAWLLFTSRRGESVVPDGGDPQGALRLAIVEAEDGATAFMLPRTTMDAVPDMRIYPADPDMRRASRVRMRYDHPELGMVLPHLAMNQLSSATPHVERLIASDRRRFARSGDALAALAIVLAVSERHGDDELAGDMLDELSEDMPHLSDVDFLLANRALNRGDVEKTVDLVRSGIAKGPPALTATVRTLQTLSIHLEGIEDVTAMRMLCARVDPGCLLTSVQIGN
jgi:hypothetical protein